MSEFNPIEFLASPRSTFRLAGVLAIDLRNHDRIRCMALGLGCFDTRMSCSAGSAACGMREDDLCRRQLEPALRVLDH